MPYGSGGFGSAEYEPPQERPVGYGTGPFDPTFARSAPTRFPGAQGLDRQDVQRRVRLIQTYVPDMAKDPGIAFRIASDTRFSDDDQFLDFVGESAGIAKASRLVDYFNVNYDELGDSELERLAKEWQQLPVAMQNMMVTWGLPRPTAQLKVRQNAADGEDGFFERVGAVASMPFRAGGWLAGEAVDLGGQALEAMGEPQELVFRGIRAGVLALEDGLDGWEALGLLAGGALAATGIGAGISLLGMGLTTAGLSAMAGGVGAGVVTFGMSDRDAWATAGIANGEGAIRKQWREKALDLLGGDSTRYELAYDLLLQTPADEVTEADMISVAEARARKAVGADATTPAIELQSSPEYIEAFQSVLELASNDQVVRAANTLAHGRISVGRLFADALPLRNDTAPYQVMSGVGDFAARIFLDPVLIASNIGKGVALSKTGIVAHLNDAGGYEAMVQRFLRPNLQEVLDARKYRDIGAIVDDGFHVNFKALRQYRRELRKLNPVERFVAVVADTFNSPFHDLAHQRQLAAFTKLTGVRGHRWLSALVDEDMMLRQQPGRILERTPEILAREATMALDLDRNAAKIREFDDALQALREAGKLKPGVLEGLQAATRFETQAGIMAALGPTSGLGTVDDVTRWMLSNDGVMKIASGLGRDYSRKFIELPNLRFGTGFSVYARLGGVAGIDRLYEAPERLWHAAAAAAGGDVDWKDINVGLRALARGQRVWGALLKGATTQIPTGPVSTTSDEGMVNLERFLRLAHSDRQATKITAEFLAETTAAGRYRLVHDAIIQTLLRYGVQDDYVRAWAGKASPFRQQLYGFKLGDDIVQSGLGGTHVAVFPWELAEDKIALPNLREVARAGLRTGIGRKYLMPAIGWQPLDKAMSNWWKPLVLMRLGFIPRAVGEELLAFTAGRGFLSPLQHWFIRPLHDLPVTGLEGVGFGGRAAGKLPWFLSPVGAAERALGHYSGFLDDATKARLVKLNRYARDPGQHPFAMTMWGWLAKHTGGLTTPGMTESVALTTRYRDQISNLMDSVASPNAQVFAQDNPLTDIATADGKILKMRPKPGVFGEVRPTDPWFHAHLDGVLSRIGRDATGRALARGAAAYVSPKLAAELDALIPPGSYGEAGITEFVDKVRHQYDNLPPDQQRKLRSLTRAMQDDPARAGVEIDKFAAYMVNPELRTALGAWHDLSPDARWMMLVPPAGQVTARAQGPAAFGTRRIRDRLAEPGDISFPVGVPLYSLRADEARRAVDLPVPHAGQRYVFRGGVRNAGTPSPVHVAAWDTQPETVGAIWSTDARVAHAIADGTARRRAARELNKAIGDVTDDDLEALGFVPTVWATRLDDTEAQTWARLSLADEEAMRASGIPLPSESAEDVVNYVRPSKSPEARRLVTIDEEWDLAEISRLEGDINSLLEDPTYQPLVAELYPELAGRHIGDVLPEGGVDDVERSAHLDDEDFGTPEWLERRIADLGFDDNEAEAARFLHAQIAEYRDRMQGYMVTELERYGQSALVSRPARRYTDEPAIVEVFSPSAEASRGVRWRELAEAARGGDRAATRELMRELALAESTTPEGWWKWSKMRSVQELRDGSHVVQLPRRGQMALYTIVVNPAVADDVIRAGWETGLLDHEGAILRRGIHRATDFPPDPERAPAQIAASMGTPSEGLLDLPNDPEWERIAMMQGPDAARAAVIGDWQPMTLWATSDPEEINRVVSQLNDAWVQWSYRRTGMPTTPPTEAAQKPGQPRQPRLAVRVGRVDVPSQFVSATDVKNANPNWHYMQPQYASHVTPVSEGLDPGVVHSPLIIDETVWPDLADIPLEYGDSALVADRIASARIEGDAEPMQILTSAFADGRLRDKLVQATGATTLTGERGMLAEAPVYVARLKAAVAQPGWVTNPAERRLAEALDRIKIVDPRPPTTYMGRPLHEGLSEGASHMADNIANLFFNRDGTPNYTMLGPLVNRDYEMADLDRIAWNDIPAVFTGPQYMVPEHPVLSRATDLFFTKALSGVMDAMVRNPLWYENMAPSVALLARELVPRLRNPEALAKVRSLYGVKDDDLFDFMMELAPYMDEFRSEVRFGTDFTRTTVFNRTRDDLAKEIGKDWREITPDEIYDRIASHAPAEVSQLFDTERQAYAEYTRATEARARVGKTSPSDIDAIGRADEAVTLARIDLEEAHVATDEQVRALGDWFQSEDEAWKQVTYAASRRAQNASIQFVDDHRIRSQLAEYGRNIFPFFYAEEQFMKRWARTLRMDPAAARRVSLLHHALTSTGIVQRDNYGDEVFVYPLSTEIQNLGEKFSRLLGKPASLGLDLPLTGQLRLALPGFDRLGAPGMSPIGSVPLSFLAERFKELQPMERTILGERGAGRGIVDQIMPASIVRFYRAFTGQPESSESFAATMNQVMTIMEAEGDGLPANATVAETEAYIDRVKNWTRSFLVVKGIYGFSGPAAPTASLFDSLRPEYQQLLRTLPLEEAQAALYSLDPDATPWTVFQSASVSKAPLPPTQAAVQWYHDHQDALNKYPMGAAWMLPHEIATETESFSQGAYSEIVALGLRERRSPEEMLRELKWAEASPEYFRVRDLYTERMAGLKGRERLAMQMEWSAWSESFMQMHPMFAEELRSPTAQITRARVIEELRGALADPDIPSVPHQAELQEMVDGWDLYNQQLSSLQYATDRRSRVRRAELRRLFAWWADEFSRQNPAVHSLYLRIIKPEIGMDDVELESVLAVKEGESYGVRTP